MRFPARLPTPLEPKSLSSRDPPGRSASAQAIGAALLKQPAPWAGQEEGSSGKIWALRAASAPGCRGAGLTLPGMCSIWSAAPHTDPPGPARPAPPGQYWAHSELGTQTGTGERGSRAKSQAWPWGSRYSGP